MAKMPKEAEALAAFRVGVNGQVVLVPQGGGALGAYQSGVYQALQEPGIEPDWVARSRPFYRRRSRGSSPTA